jgi:hypothetical protein
MHWSVLVNMIVSRSYGSPSGAAALQAGMAILSCVRFGERGPGRSWLDENSMQNVRKLKNEGTEISTCGFRL